MLPSAPGVGRVLQPPHRRNFSRRSRRSVAASRPANDASASRRASPSRRNRLGRIAMRAAQRLGHDRVDHAEGLEVLRRHAHRLGRLRRLVRGAPQDRRAAFGADHRIDGMFEHQHAIAAASAIAPPDPPSPTIAATTGNTRGRHASVERAIASAWPRSSASMPGRRHRVDQRHHRQAEPVGHLNQPDRLAIAFGFAHAEIVAQAGGGVGALFVTDPITFVPRNVAKPPMIA